MQNYATKFLEKILTIEIDRPLGSKHPRNDMIYHLNYGFVPNTKAPDGHEVDAYILGVNEPVDEFTGKCIAVIHRTNDDDDKLIIISENDMHRYTDKEIIQATNFQEQYFKSEIIRK